LVVVVVDPAFITVVVDPAFVIVVVEPALIMVVVDPALVTVVVSVDAALVTVSVRVSVDPAFVTVAVDPAFVTVAVDPATLDVTVTVIFGILDEFGAEHAREKYVVRYTTLVTVIGGGVYVAVQHVSVTVSVQYSVTETTFVILFITGSVTVAVQQVSTSLTVSVQNSVNVVFSHHPSSYPLSRYCAAPNLEHPSTNKASQSGCMGDVGFRNPKAAAAS
jgi:hypothetical protein